MKINWDLVDQFQQRFGEQATFARTRDFMFAYISQVRAPLPPLTIQGLAVAKKFREGAATAEERSKVLNDVWAYISENKAWGDIDPKYSIVRVVTWLVRDQLGPGEREHISEVLREFVAMVNDFEDQSDSAPLLVRRFFSSE